MSGNIPLISIRGLSSNDFCISFIILKSSQVQESLGKMPDWQTMKSSFSIKYSNVDVNIIFSIILANIESKLIGRYLISTVLRSFLWVRTILTFLQSSGKTPSFKAVSNMIWVMLMIHLMFLSFLLEYYPKHEIYLDLVT